MGGEGRDPLFGAGRELINTTSSGTCTHFALALFRQHVHGETQQDCEQKQYDARASALAVGRCAIASDGDRGLGWRRREA